MVKENKWKSRGKVESRGMFCVCLVFLYGYNKIDVYWGKK